MNRTIPSSVRAEPNVTPMIDVMLVLLVIFMTVAPLLAAELRATPPQARFRASHPDEEDDAMIDIDASARLYLGRAAIDSGALRQRLATWFSAHPSNRVVYLRADQSLPYEKVQSVMTLASSAGASVVGLVAIAPPPSRAGH